MQRRRSDFAAEVHGNGVRVRVVESVPGTPKLIGFVHNPDPGADIALLDEAQAKIRGLLRRA